MRLPSTSVRRLLLVLIVAVLCLTVAVDAKSKDCRKTKNKKKKGCRKPGKKKPAKSPSPRPQSPPPPSSPSPLPSSSPPPSPPSSPYLISYDVVRTRDWDPALFTQGLQVARACSTCPKRVYASSGLRGASYISSMDVNTLETVDRTDLADDEFGEGVNVLDGKLYQVTFQTDALKVYDARSLELVDTMRHPRADGWGLTDNGLELIMSDGSSNLVYFRPDNPSQATRELEVTFEGSPVRNLNELEYRDGYIYANVWRRPCIAKIDSATGDVVGWLDGSRLKAAAVDPGRSPSPPYATFDHPINGVAWDGDRMWVTGKYWTKVFEVKETGATRIEDVEAVKRLCLAA